MKISFNNSSIGDDEQMSLFSFFGEEEEAKDKKAEVTEASEETDDGEDSVEVYDGDDGEDTKPAKKTVSKTKKASGKKKNTTSLTCPVTVVGTGWTFTYSGTAGDKVEQKEVVKAAFLNGYTEVMCAAMKVKDNVIYVDSVGQSPDSDENAIPKAGLDISLGNLHVKLSAEDFGMDPEEISLFDVTEYFIKAQPDFAGCALKTEGTYAVPVFEKEYSLDKIADGETVKVWSDSGIKEFTPEEAKALFADDKLFISDSGIIFNVPGAKGASNIYISKADIKEGYEALKTEKAVEKYQLPFVLVLFGMKKNCTAENFGGKEKITREELIDFLKPEFRVFRSRSRKVDVIYEKAKDLVSVAVISGEKGAVFAECMNAPERVEETVVGTFTGTYAENLRDIKKLSFELSLPKIDGEILDEIVSYFRKDLTKEAMVQIYWNDVIGYYIAYPKYASVSKTSVKYTMPKNGDTLVMTVHSHNTMPAVFSKIDDEDECYTGLFGVIGNLGPGRTVRMSFRAGMEGCFVPVFAGDLFERKEVRA